MTTESNETQAPQEPTVGKDLSKLSQFGWIVLALMTALGSIAVEYFPDWMGVTKERLEQAIAEINAAGIDTTSGKAPE